MARKKSQKERKRRKLERAVAGGDEGALRRLSSQTPVRAAEACLTQLRAAAPDATTHPLDDFAAELAERLRREQQLERALEVAAAGRRRTGRLRVEEALAAFALGRDDLALQIVEQDAVVARLLEPLLAAVHGTVVKGGRGGAGRSPALRALHTAAGVVARLAMQPPDPVGARRAAGQIEARHRGAVWQDELVAASRIDTLRGARQLLASRRFRRVPQHLEALAQEVAEPALAPAVQQALGECGRSLAVDTPLGYAQRAQLADLDPAVATSQLADVDPQIFPEDQRGVVLLYQGFAALLTNPDRATSLLERAVEWGGPLLESLRGRWLVALGRLRQLDPERGDGRGQVRELTNCAERFDRALARDPDALAVRCALALRMVDCCAPFFAREGPAWVARARTLAEALGGLPDEEVELLDRHEGLLVIDSDPQRALELGERMVARRSGSVAGWLLRVGAGDRLNRPEVDDWTLEGARLTGDADLLDRARAIRRERGEDSLFVDLDAARLTPGRLAAELAEGVRRVRAGGAAGVDGRSSADGRDGAGGRGGADGLDKVLEQAARWRERLATEDRLPFDVAALAIAIGADPSFGAHQLERLLGVWCDSPEAVRALATVAIDGDLEDELVSIGERLARDARQRPALQPLLAVLAPLSTPLASRLVGRIAPGLGASELRPLQRVIANPSVLSADPLASIDRRLAPSFSIEAGLDMDVDAAPPDWLEDDMEEFESAELDEAFDRAGGVPAQLSGMFQAMMAQLGASPERLAAMRPNEMDRLMRRMEPIMSQDPTPAGMLRLQQVFEEFGLVDPGAPPPWSQRPARVGHRKEQRNRDKRRRKNKKGKKR